MSLGFFYKIADFFGRYVFSKIRKPHPIIKKEISLISSDCLGGIILHEEQKRFLTPTINLYFNADDFVKFVLNLNYYLSIKPKPFPTKEKYPVLLLDDIKLFCVHYKSFEEAIEKWVERKKRIIDNNIVILMSDRNGFTDETYNNFLNIPYPKILLTCNPKFTIDSVLVKKYAQANCIGDLSKYTFFGKRRVITISLQKRINQLLNEGRA